jgi:hypothetical protein
MGESRTVTRVARAIRSTLVQKAITDPDEIERWTGNRLEIERIGGIGVVADGHAVWAALWIRPGGIQGWWRIPAARASHSRRGRLPQHGR